MKSLRGLLVCKALVLCAVIVLGAMTWLTRGVVESERERAGAESRADLEERTRLALWRMDAAGAAIIAGENRRPPADYDADSPTAAVTADPAVKLHFELRQSGRLTSPEISPTASPEVIASNLTKLTELRKLLGSNPLPGDEWSVLTCAAEAGEVAWNAVPKMADHQKSSNQALRQMKGASQVRNDADYQTNFNGAELAQRAKSVSETVVSQTVAADPLESGRVTQTGILRAVWVGGELLLLRQVSATLGGSLDKGVQGVWLDQAVLGKRLLAEVADLLPASSLAAAGPEAALDPLALVSFPFRLHRNEPPPAVTSGISSLLLVGWGAVLLALLTASWLVRGVMRLSERRASFVSAVTHELRTPLTTFRLYSDMLESGAVKPDKQGDYLRVLSREADRLSHLVENVLSFSQIERGNARSVVRQLGVGQLLEPMRERLEARLATAGMTLALDTSPVCLVRVDTAAVEHILFNLIDNAAKYASGGQPPRVEISVKTSPREVEIIVSDHGPGIPAAERNRIFQAFHKSAREAAESRPGVGLGLALSRRLAKSLGGGLECVPSDQGACFVLRLPLITA